MSIGSPASNPAIQGLLNNNFFRETIQADQPPKPVGKSDAKKVGGTDATQTSVGTGSTSSTGPTPDATTTAPLMGQFMTAALASLAGMMPKGLDSSDSILAEAAAAIMKLKKTTDDVAKGKIETEAKAKNAALESQNAKIAEAQTKTEEAAKAAKHVSLADKFKLAFTYIGAILAIAVACVAIATGVGAPAGAALIAAGILALAMAVDETVQMVNKSEGKNDSLGMFGMMFEAIGKSEGKTGDDLKKFTDKATMGLQIALTIVSVALSLVNPEAAVTDLPEIAEDVGMLAGKTTEVAVAATKMERVAAKVEALTAKFEGAVEKFAGKVEKACDDVLAKLKTIKSEGGLKQIEKGFEELKTALKALKVDGGVKIEKMIKEIIDEYKAAKQEGYVADKAAKARDAVVDTVTSPTKLMKFGDHVNHTLKESAHTAANVEQNKADKAIASSKTLKGEADEDGATIKNEEGLIDTLLKAMKHGGEQIENQLDQVVDAMNSHGQSMAHAGHR